MFSKMVIIFNFYFKSLFKLVQPGFSSENNLQSNKKVFIKYCWIALAILFGISVVRQQQMDSLGYIYGYQGLGLK